MSNPIDVARKVLRIESEAIGNLLSRLDDNFEKVVDIIYRCEGRIVVTGMGKSGVICKKIAATLASTGTPAFFLHPAEAVHGDLGMVVGGDVVLALSQSGETKEILELIEVIRRLGATLISLVGRSSSSLARLSDVFLDVSVDREACPIGLAPTASTTASLALGDAIAVACMEKRGFGVEDFALYHPGGSIGKKFVKVHQLMHKGDEIPKVFTHTPMRDVICEMTSKGLGLTTVVSKEECLEGIIVDGDLRRLLQREDDVLGKKAEECMTRNPVRISRDELSVSALKIMEDRKITSLLIVDERGGVEGVLHLHDLWRTQMF